MYQHHTDDNKDLQLFIAGNEEAFDAIFRRHYAALLNFAKVLIPYPSDEAEDIVAEMFCNLWHNRRKLTITNTLRAYLYVSVRNRVLDHYRKRKQIFSMPEEAGAEASTEGYLQPDHLLMYKDAATRVQYMVEQLPPQMRLVFQMHRNEGFSYDEIASLLNISVNSVKTHMFRAIKILRSAWVGAKV